MDSCYVYAGLGAPAPTTSTISAKIASPTPVKTTTAVKTATTTRASEKTRRRGLAIAAAKKAAAMMKRGEKLAAAWKKANGDPTVLKALQNVVAAKAAGKPLAGYAGFGATAPTSLLTSSDISEIANAAFKTLQSNGAFTKPVSTAIKPAATVTTVRPTVQPLIQKIIALVKGGIPLEDALQSEDASIASLKQSASAGNQRAIDAIQAFTAAGIWPMNDVDFTTAVEPIAETGVSTKTKLLIGGGLAGLVGIWLVKRKKK